MQSKTCQSNRRAFARGMTIGDIGYRAAVDRVHGRHATWLALFVGLLIFSDPPAARAATDSDQASIALFESKIRPVLVEHCYECHSAEAKKLKAGLLLDTRAGWQKGGDSGVVIVRGKPEESSLLKAIRHDDPDSAMPPKKRLSPEVVAAFEKWIADGAVDPRDEVLATAEKKTGVSLEEGRKFWAFQPVKDAPLPPVKDEAWVKTPPDRFILARLESSGLQPAPSADKHTLLRRVTLDLTGLPPTADEIHAFIEDASPQAYETVVERLLESPRYGEQWGRHWLDVARFAEGAGGDSDWVYRLAWRYRDYVIAAFNADKPYDQFIVEQLAGDLLPKSTSAAVNLERAIATGFLHVGRKPLAERDKQQMMLEVVDEQVNTTGIAFMGLTIACARCHDHKFDPIPARDYYSMAGMFMSTRTVADRVSDSMFLEYEMPDENGRPVLVMAVRDEKQPTVMQVHTRGSYKTLGELAPHGFLRVIAGDDQPPLTSAGSGRLELARWIASADHPLTARVMVNRIWQHHFGTGLVASSGDFGYRGEQPSHPELLDDLARRFVESGWSVKAMQRLMVLSSTYRQANVVNEKAHEIDPENRLLWTMSRRRMSAEQVRDSILAVSGQLDEARGGSMLLYRDGWGRPRQYPKEGVYDRAIYGFRVRDKSYPPFERDRRSVYLPQIRSIQSECMRLFDGPDLGGPVSLRGESTVAPQSLFFINSPFVEDAAIALARQCSDTCNSTGRADALRLAYLRVFGRPPDAQELSQAETFVRNYEQQVRRQSPENGAASQRDDLVWYDKIIRQTPGLFAYYRLDELHEFSDPQHPHTAVNSAKPGVADGRYLHHMKWKKQGGGFFDAFSFNDVAFGRWGALNKDTSAGRRNTSVGFNMPYEWPFDDQSDTGVNRGHQVRVDDVANFNEASELTLEYWLQPIIAPWTGMVVGRDDGNGGQVFRSGIQPATIDGQPKNVVYYEFAGEGNGGLRTGADARFVAEAAQWTHVAFSLGKDMRRMFINGELVDECAVSGLLPTADAPFTIAARPDEQDWFAGMVDEVAVYSSVLPPEDIRLRVEAASGRLQQATSLSPQLIAWTAFCKALLSANDFVFIE